MNICFSSLVYWYKTAFKMMCLHFFSLVLLRHFMLVISTCSLWWLFTFLCFLTRDHELQAISCVAEWKFTVMISRNGKLLLGLERTFFRDARQDIQIWCFCWSSQFIFISPVVSEDWIILSCAHLIWNLIFMQLMNCFECTFCFTIASSGIFLLVLDSW